MTKYIIHNFIHLVKNFFRSLLLTQRFVLITFIDYSIIAPLCLPLFYNFFEKGLRERFRTMLPSGFPTPLCHFERSREISHQKVSCRCESHRYNAALSFRAERSEVEKSPADLFPVGVILNRPMTNRKPVANSFLPVCYTIGPCRIGNFSQTVSCRNDSQSSHAE